MQERAEAAYVRFTAQVDLAFGEDLYLCGSSPSMGSWGLDHAVKMTWSSGGLWTAEMVLPCGVSIEFKVVRRGQGGSPQWIGAGSAGEDNVIMETNLGRRGGRASRIVSTGTVPMGLQVEDLGVGPADAFMPAGRSDGAPAVGQEVHNRPRHDSPAPGTLALPETVQSSPQPTPEMQAALAAGRPVTYATTTTTTTYVTIGGNDGSTVEQSCMMMPPTPGNVPLALGPGGGGPPPHQASAPPPGGEHAGAQAHGPSRGGGGAALPDAQEEAQLKLKAEATAEARRFNSDLPRLGCAALAWRQPGAKQVRIQGSWDGWAKPVALEPIPGGGFGVLLALDPGEYEFKYIVDGDWKTSDEHEKRGDMGNNVVTVGDALVLPQKKIAALANVSCTLAIANAPAEGGA